MALCTFAACGGGTLQDDGAQYLTLELDETPLSFDAATSANDPPAASTVHFITVGGSQNADWSGPSSSLQLVSPGVGLGTFDGTRDELHGAYSIPTASGATTKGTEVINPPCRRLNENSRDEE